MFFCSIREPPAPDPGHESGRRNSHRSICLRAVDQLKSVKRFQRFVDDAIKRLTLDTVFDSAELCAQMHPDRREGLRVIAEPQCVSSALQWTSDDEENGIFERKYNYWCFKRMGHGECALTQPLLHANIEVLDKLIAARHELAQMSRMVKSRADQEFMRLGDLKRVKCGRRDVDLEFDP